MKRRIEVSMENSRSMERQISLAVRRLFFFLKVQWMCISLGSLVESCDYSNLRAALAWLIGLMLWHALWAQYGYIYTENVYNYIPRHTTPDMSARLSPIRKGLQIYTFDLQLSHFHGRKHLPVWLQNNNLWPRSKAKELWSQGNLICYGTIRQHLWGNELLSGGLCSPSSILHLFLHYAVRYLLALTCHPWPSASPPSTPSELPTNPHLSSVPLPSTNSIVSLIPFHFHQVVAVEL